MNGALAGAPQRGLGRPAATRQARVRLALRRRGAARQARHPRRRLAGRRASALHVANGAAFGAVYALVRPFVPGPPSWPRRRPRRSPSTSPAGRSARWSTATTRPAASWSRCGGNRRAFAQATWRHLLFGVVLGELERRLNAADEFEPLEDVPVASNGHGNIEHAAVGAA